MPKEKAARLIVELKQLPLGSARQESSERDRDVTRKRLERSESARIAIPECVNPQRREACLADPEQFLKTYMPRKFRQEFGRVHVRMIGEIHDRARLGGKKSLAAPRGRGKSTIVKGMNIYLVCAELVRFIVPICATLKIAGRVYRDFRDELSTNDLLLEDFPEICAPIRALEGAPQRAGKQHIDGSLTHIYWSASDFVRLPRVPGSANEYLRSQGREWSPYGGVKMAFLGFDTAFRGLNIDDDRPDYLIIDDPETRESAKSIEQIADRIEIIEKDIEGLEGQDKPIAMMMITTLQNRYCLSAQFTDREKKPAWDGERYGWVEKWPDRMDLWEHYITLRRAGQIAGDRHGMNAVDFYLGNREAMDAGVEMLAYTFKPITLEDGRETVYSSIQEAFNKIADTSMDAFRTEYQNDPPAEQAIETAGLTAARVASRIHRLTQREAPSTTEARILGIDIGKHNSHWVDTAWEGASIGSIVDYGVMETHGMTMDSDSKAIELAILASLEVWADEVAMKANPMLVLIDSGTYTEAIYEFCRRRGRPFYPSKGWAHSRFRMPAEQQGKKPLVEAWAHELTGDRVILYNVNTEWWKKWLQQRFITAPYDDAGNRNDGSLTLYDPGKDAKRHLSFSHHITAEEEQLVPVHGGESKRVWFVKNRNNHWLDATALACAGAGSLGFRLVTQQQPVKVVVQKPINSTPAYADKYGRPFVATRR